MLTIVRKIRKVELSLLKKKEISIETCQKKYKRAKIEYQKEEYRQNKELINFFKFR